MKNYKSNTTYIIFVALFIYSVLQDKNIELINFLGSATVILTFAMMLRSETLATILTNISESIKSR